MPTDNKQSIKWSLHTLTGKEISDLWNSRFHHRFHESLSWNTKSVYIFIHHFLNIHFNIILPFKSSCTILPEYFGEEFHNTVSTKSMWATFLICVILIKNIKDYYKFKIFSSVFLVEHPLRVKRLTRKWRRRNRICFASSVWDSRTRSQTNTHARVYIDARSDLLQR
jgi:hypothetical protein